MQMKPRTAATVVALAVAGLAVAAPTAGASGTKLSQATAASQFSSAGITWSSSGGCTTRSNSTCTSFDQINSGTVSAVITLKQASGCAINITGGTEVGHASGTYSHYNGYKVDISRNSCIDGYIQNSFTYIGNRSDGYPQWKAASGNLYCNEGSHWDILIY
ncbi:hypothetical protein ACFVVU_09790 [Kitasatospora sp. NPDC057965]|uniref:hypothetical protein n=1 Tax=unclassified Kitasatospora TaxID=2633591 RepID=UPI0036A47B1E